MEKAAAAGVGVRMVAWDVYRGRRCIDTAFYMPDCDAEYVRSSLVGHDGYPADITVRRRPA